jgi:ubiquinone/menaquinone biosynthesis C-methylase UbiE
MHTQRAQLPEPHARRYGKVFDEIAAEYDRRRPAYPDELIDRACQVAGIGSGDQVLEVGCGTGQLTRGLVARGLHVTALEPGSSLLALARQNLEGAGVVEFVNAQFEDASLRGEQFQAVFSASAFHWLDPKVSWQKSANVLVPGGTLALVQYCGLQEPRSRRDQEALLAAMTKVAPDVAANWPTYRDLESTLAGMEARRGNVSEVWAWLGSYDIGQDYAGRLFGDVQVAVAMPKLIEHTPDELNALVRTMSFYAHLSPAQRHALEREYEALINDSDARFGLARWRLSSRHGEAPSAETGCLMSGCHPHWLPAGSGRPAADQPDGCGDQEQRESEQPAALNPLERPEPAVGLIGRQ